MLRRAHRMAYASIVPIAITLIATFTTVPRPASALALPLADQLATAVQRSSAYADPKAEARRVTITRDGWGIPRVQGDTQADAVFGEIYAQCEDDFQRVQSNLLGALGWTARTEGKTAIWEELREHIAEKSGPKMLLGALASATARLEKNFGYWGVPWGQFNRHQRLDDSIHPHFGDSKPSFPVPFTSSIWSSLAASNAHRWPGTYKLYGGSGNSFVAVIDFGPKVSARAIHVGVQSDHSSSLHFTDRVERWTAGDLRTVYFWPNQLKGHSTRTYHAGS